MATSGLQFEIQGRYLIGCVCVFLTWDQALFSFRLVNKIPAGNLIWPRKRKFTLPKVSLISGYCFRQKGRSPQDDKFGVLFQISKRKIVWWQFLFWKNLSALATISLIRHYFMERTTNDWHEQHIFVYLSRCCLGRSFVRGPTEDSLLHSRF